MGKNLKMNDDVYKLRRRVMAHIYEAKNLLRSKGVDLPRIDVRITDNEAEEGWRGALGVADLGGNIIWVSQRALSKWKANLKEIVFHEIVHAVTGFNHDDDCKLMCPCVAIKSISDGELNKAFLKYFKVKN